MLLQCGIAVLCRVAGLVPLRALTATAVATPGGGGEADVSSVENEAEGTEWGERTTTGQPTESDLAEIDFSSVDDGRGSLVGSLAGVAVPTRKSRFKKHSILIGTLLGVMLASLGAAAHHSGAFAGLTRRSDNVAERIKKLASLESQATDLAGDVVSDESRVALKFFKDAIASAKEAAAQAAASAAAKEAPQQQQQEDIDLHLAYSMSALRFLLKSARDRANAMTKELEAIVERSASKAELGDAEIGVLNDELTEAYRITRKALKTSIAVGAGNAEEAMKKLEKLPPLRREDDGHLVSEAQGYIRFIESQAKSCAFADQLLSKYDTHLATSHMQYHVNEKLKIYLGIEKLHASMEAHKALALQALGQQDSALSSDVVQSLTELVKAMYDLEEQFTNVSESLSRLMLSDSTASTAEASANTTAEAAKFMAFHEVCLVKLKQSQHFFDSCDVLCVEGSEVLKAVMESAFLRCEADRDYMLGVLKFMREKRQGMSNGTIGGFERPLVSAELMQRVVGEMEAMEQSIIDAMNQMWAAANETEGGTFKDDLEVLERVHKAQINMLRFTSRSDELNSIFKMLTSLELDIASSIGVYESVEQGRKGEGIAPRSEKVTKLLRQFRAGVSAAKKAATLTDVAQAAKALRALSDQLVIATFRQHQDHLKTWTFHRLFSHAQSCLRERETNTSQQTALFDNFEATSRVVMMRVSRHALTTTSQQTALFDNFEATSRVVMMRLSRHAVHGEGNIYL
ncbi:hypothetical protein Esti_005065 [Eimeria stiedai]